MKGAAILALLLAGCANTWHHPTKSAQDGQRDAYECEREAAPVLDPMRNSAMRERCLRLRGWKPEQ